MYIPLVEKDEIIPVEIENIDELEPGYKGILEPKRSKDKKRLEDPSKLDLVVVPGVGFTKNGLRLGMGGGHFDRFLSKTDLKKIGLAFKEQVVDNIPSEPHDVKMDFVLSDD